MRRSTLVVLVLVVALSRQGLARRLSNSTSRIVASRVRGAIELPPQGEGYLVPLTWRLRGLSFGVPRLVALIQRAAARVRERIPGATLYVADLSAQRGGATSWHHSHRSGHDADLLFYSLDERGQPALPPVQMLRFEPPGIAWTQGEEGQPAHVELDDARNWQLVCALLEDPEAKVTRVFVADWIKRRLLTWARENAEPFDLIARAEEVLEQPNDSAPHDDHMHVRIAAAPGEISHVVARQAKTKASRLRRPLRRGI